MNAPKTSQSLKPQHTYFAAIFLVLLSTVACQRRCQPASTELFASVTQTQWRLAQTTDPTVSETLDNFNFLIVQFGSNGTGAVNRVVSNDMFETPIATILWVPNAKSQLMRIQYSSVPAEGSTQSGTQGDLGTFDYRYELGRELELFEQQTGNYYRYVPFTGVVNPDTECQF
jgi:hypothetical protein